MNIRNLFRPTRYKGYLKWIGISLSKMHPYAYASFSQTGEDLLILSAFRFLKIQKPTYLDIGAHHPTHLSNTFRLYREGCHGICVEPNPALAKLFARTRPRDTILPIAIGTKNGTTTLHIVSDDALSTISPTHADYFSSASKHSIAQEIQVEERTVMSVLQKYFPHSPPDLVSLDIEGMDLAVIQSINFDMCRPAVFCIETLTYDESGAVHKITQIVQEMESNGYFVFADTFLNTIFVDQKRWNNR